MHVLQAMNHNEGVALLSNSGSRLYVRELNERYPDLFVTPLNEAQCRYLAMLIRSKLSPEEAGQLFREKRADYDGIWCRSIYELKITSEKTVDANSGIMVSLNYE